MLIIGIAAAPAGGKSTVAAHLAALGATWINADKIAHEVLEMPLVIQRVTERFGADVLGADGKIQRHKLAKLVFGDDDDSRMGLRYLESLIHPPTRELILKRIAEARDAGTAATVLDIPLLFENNWAAVCDEIWFVDTAPEIQNQAAKQRGWSAETLASRQARQLSITDKRRLSTRIIPNHGTLSELTGHVDKLWRDCVNATATDTSQLPIDSHCQPSRPRGH
jgi:dephospho-CoA kinase